MTKEQVRDALWISTDDEGRAALDRREEMLKTKIKENRDAIADLETNRLFDHLQEPEIVAEMKERDDEMIKVHLKSIAFLELAQKDIKRRKAGAEKLLRSYIGPKKKNDDTEP